MVTSHGIFNTEQKYFNHFLRDASWYKMGKLYKLRKNADFTAVIWLELDDFLAK